MDSPVSRRNARGPFDVIGDVHGCLEELEDLFRVLAYDRAREGVWVPSGGRTAVFVGDLVDRGPMNVAVTRTVMAMAANGHALCVPGNHDERLRRYLARQPVPLVYGLAETVTEFDRESDGFRAAVLAFYQAMPSHYVLDDGRLVVAHTGLAERLHGQESPEIRHLAAWGVSEGDIDPVDIEKRHPWVATYGGDATVVYGHTPVVNPEWRQRTIDIDTGCVFGGRLTALRWPERELISVRARRAYASMPRFQPVD